MSKLDGINVGNNKPRKFTTTRSK